MKKLLTAALFALLGTGAFAQTSQGTVVVSGQLTFTASSSEVSKKDTISHTSRGASFRIAPSIGYMFAENLELGAVLRFSHSTSKNIYFNNEGDSNGMTTKTNAFDISPYLKRYFMLSEQFALTGRLSTGLGVYKTRYDANTNYQPNRFFFTAALTPGVTYFPSDKLGVSASLGGLRYEQSLIKMEADDTLKKTSSFLDVGFENALSFSLNYYINR